MSDKIDINLYILNVCSLLPVPFNKEILTHSLKFLYNEGWYISEAASYVLYFKEVSPHLNEDYAYSRISEINDQVAKRLRNESNGL